MESVITAVVTGVLTLVGVLVSNSRSQAVIEVKLDKLASKVESTTRWSRGPTGSSAAWRCSRARSRP